MENGILASGASNAMQPNRIAVLVDGDNAYLEYLERVMAEAGGHGSVVARRIYGARVRLDSGRNASGATGSSPHAPMARMPRTGPWRTMPWACSVQGKPTVFA